MDAQEGQLKYILATGILCGFIVAGCAYSIADIDVSKVESTCARQCTETYSACVSGGNQIGLKTETLRACKEGYEACIKTCPAK
jgi:hypothetical protein